VTGVVEVVPAGITVVIPVPVVAVVVRIPVVVISVIAVPVPGMPGPPVVRIKTPVP
jgi:hypothetical protein